LHAERDHGAASRKRFLASQLTGRRDLREAINAGENENKRELEDLLSALHDIRWNAEDRRSE
jgi:hypothetical protein